MLSAALTSFTTFFATIGPIEAAVLFATFTPHMAPRDRRAIALRAVLIAFIILAAATLFGGPLLRQLGVGIPALQTAGGILLLMIALEMVFAKPSSTFKLTPPRAPRRKPRMISPCSRWPHPCSPVRHMSAGILLAANAHGDPEALAVTVATLAAVMLVTLAFLMAAHQLSRFLGVTAQRVLMRVFGILLAAIAVQAMFNGLLGSGLIPARTISHRRPLPATARPHKELLMFQTFDSIADPSVGAPRLALLRAELARLNLDAFLVPRADEHQGEYVPHWPSASIGSPASPARPASPSSPQGQGRAVRRRPLYRAGPRSRSTPRIFEICRSPTAKLSDWLERKLPRGAAIGFDPWLHDGRRDRAASRGARRQAASRCKPIAGNPSIRSGARTGRRRRRPGDAAADRACRRAPRGEDRRLQSDSTRRGQDAVVLTLPELDLPGCSTSAAATRPTIPCRSPSPSCRRPASRAVRRPGKDRRAMSRAHLAAIAALAAPATSPSALAALQGAGKRVRLDHGDCGHAGSRATLGGGKRRSRAAPIPACCRRPRKTAAEIEGARAAHKRDGAALARFLAWLDREAPTGQLDEIAAVEKLEAFAPRHGALRDISFDTISGSRPQRRHRRTTA